MQQRTPQWDQPEHSDGSWELLTVWNVLNLLHCRERRSLGHFSSWNTPQRMHSFITLPLWSCDAYREQSVPMCLSGECDTIPSLSASCRRILPKLSKLWKLFWKPRVSSSSSWQERSWCSEYSSTTTKLLIWSWIWRSNWDLAEPWEKPNKQKCYSELQVFTHIRRTESYILFPAFPWCPLLARSKKVLVL